MVDGYDCGLILGLDLFFGVMLYWYDLLRYFLHLFFGLEGVLCIVGCDS